MNAGAPRRFGWPEVMLAAPAEATVEVVDALGRVVTVLHRGTLPAGETQLATGLLAPGTYVVSAWGVSAAFVVVR